MNTIKLFKFATLIVCAVFAMTFTSCTDDDNNLSTIKFNPSAVAIAVGNSQNVTVSGGTGTYTAKSSNENVAKVTVNKSKITVSGIATGKATVTVTDSKNASNSFNVIVDKGIVVDKTSVSISVGQECVVAVSGGATPYTVVSANTKIATASISSGKITIKGVAAGKTTVTITDKNKKTATVAVAVLK